MQMPPGTLARLEMSPPSTVCCVVLVPPGSDGATLQRGRVTNLLAFDADMDWPDRRGERLVGFILGEGEPVVLEFQNLADALSCKRKLQRCGVA